MSKIKSKNTKAELITFAYLRKEKIYFQKHYKKAPGSPDIALPRKKKAVFIDGDFWHGRTFDALIKRRGSTVDPWVKKIARNMERDKEQRELLISLGWQFLIIWQEDILRKRTSPEALGRIKNFLTQSIK